MKHVYRILLTYKAGFDGFTNHLMGEFTRAFPRTVGITSDIGIPDKEGFSFTFTDTPEAADAMFRNLFFNMKQAQIAFSVVMTGNGARREEAFTPTVFGTLDMISHGPDNSVED